MKGSMKYVVAMVVALTVSSALVAAPLGSSKSCSPVSSDTAIWGNSLDNNVTAQSGCLSSQGKETTVVRGTSESSQSKSGMFGVAKGVFDRLTATVETAIWGFVPPPQK